MLATRFYSPREVGIVTALISTINLLGGFSRLGLEFGVIKYLPNENEKEKLINSCLTIITTVAILLSLTFIILSDFLSPALSFLKYDLRLVILFVLFTVFFSLTLFQQRVFLAFRRAEFTFLQASINSSLKVFLIFPFVHLGILGLLLSWGLPNIIAIMFSLYIFMPYLYREYFPKIRIDKRVVNDMLHFSFGNYVAENLWYLPSRLLPLLIINVLSAEMTAYFYIAWSIASVLYVIPSVVGMSLFTEGSYNRENLKSKTINAVKFTLLVFTPVLLGVVLFSDKILLLFGRSYSVNASNLLRILALTGIPYAFVHFYVSIERIIGKVEHIIASYALIAFISIVATYILLPVIGIIGVGIAWLLSHLIVVILISTRTRYIKKILRGGVWAV